MEKAAVDDMLASSKIPTPKGELWNAIVEHYSLGPDCCEHVDSVQSKVKLPKGWKVQKNPSDPYGRCCDILDHEEKKVGSTFLKNTGYDYYGHTSFNKDRLKELGVVN